VKNAAGIPS